MAARNYLGGCKTLYLAMPCGAYQLGQYLTRLARQIKVQCAVQTGTVRLICTTVAPDAGKQRAAQPVHTDDVPTLSRHRRTNHGHAATGPPRTRQTRRRPVEPNRQTRTGGATRRPPLIEYQTNSCTTDRSQHAARRLPCKWITSRLPALVQVVNILVTTAAGLRCCMAAIA